MNIKSLTKNISVGPFESNAQIMKHISEYRISSKLEFVFIFNFDPKNALGLIFRGCASQL